MSKRDEDCFQSDRPCGYVPATYLKESIDLDDLAHSSADDAYAVSQNDIFRVLRWSLSSYRLPALVLKIVLTITWATCHYNALANRTDYAELGVICTFASPPSNHLDRADENKLISFLQTNTIQHIFLMLLTILQSLVDKILRGISHVTYSNVIQGSPRRIPAKMIIGASLGSSIESDMSTSTPDISNDDSRENTNSDSSGSTCCSDGIESLDEPTNDKRWLESQTPFFMRKSWSSADGNWTALSNNYDVRNRIIGTSFKKEVETEDGRSCQYATPKRPVSVTRSSSDDTLLRGSSQQNIAFRPRGWVTSL